MRQIEVREEDFERLRALGLAEDRDVPETIERLVQLVRPERMPKLEGYLGRAEVVEPVLEGAEWIEREGDVFRRS